MTLDKERLRVLASDFTSHPLSRGISDIEEAGEGLYALLSENAALAAEVERLRARVQELGQIARENRSVKVVGLESEMERLRKDAGRYQWLRSRLPGSAYRIAGVVYSEGGAGVDAAIDAAMADKGGTAS